ncbi:ATP binding protein with AAA and HATPase domains [Psychroflexus torquis ATCC 700755]|uniref:ATP binding protein with AAA and HATPase domains n=1 Tax=Psychroflexus torquis (strain ATCC 700755 / CIP 106069 / ACAM 623) TaxID=313595 RepID=K4IVS5_PSYTT|nr:ATP-binding protein [Psychroflexus torquis]AFU69555.1 ATP binding protein with AAA and HATPase domains [Psychroflexus torquis ATCC 700755]
MNILTKIQQPEGRRLEFKEVPPTNAELARTIVSFANDAGGELFVGIKNNPREITGLPQHQLDTIENRISNIVNDQCTIIVLPEITFIDQKTIGTSISLQPEEAYQFVLRHISQGTEDYKGVYRNDRWEYPLIAIREVIRNAVIHRDYSLTGKDIKIAIFDDKLEITSPGKLLPTVDFNDMDAGQSDVRNKVLAPVFKRLGIIEQWGNGLQLIADDLNAYPEIELAWKEAGIAFRVSFIKKNYQAQLESQLELRHELEHELQHESLFSKTLQIVATKTSATKEIALALGQKNISGYLKKVIGKLLEQQLIEWTIPETPKSSKQQYKITKRGVAFLQLLHKKNE